MGTEQAIVNFNLFHKNQVADWIPDANVNRITTSGTYRLFAQDTETGITRDRYYGLRVPGYAGREYWIEYRQRTVGACNSGLLINWGGTMLLDMQPGTAAGFGDAALPPGRTFTDPQGVSIAITARGGTTPDWVDVTVNLPIAASAPPVIVAEENTDRAIALNATTFTRDPFSLITAPGFGSDANTRVTLFVANLLPGDDILGLLVTAQDDQSRDHLLPIEYVGQVPGFDWLKQINVRLPDAIAGVGDLWLRVTARSITSNRTRISVR